MLRLKTDERKESVRNRLREGNEVSRNYYQINERDSFEELDQSLIDPDQFKKTHY